MEPVQCEDGVFEVRDDGEVLHPIFRGQELPDHHLRDARIVDPEYDRFFDGWQGCAFVHRDPMKRTQSEEMGFVVMVTPCGFGLLWKVRRSLKGDITVGWAHQQYSGKWWVMLPSGMLDLAARVRRYWLFAEERWETPLTWTSRKPWIHAAMSEGLRNLRDLKEIDDGSAEAEQGVLRQKSEARRRKFDREREGPVEGALSKAAR